MAAVPNVVDLLNAQELKDPVDLKKPSNYIGQVIVILFLLLIATGIVYTTGGTGYAYPYLVLLPIILSAAWFGVYVAIGCSLASGILLGPYMPLDVASETYQSPQNWVARIGFFLLIGIFASWLFKNLREANKKNLQILRIDHETGLKNQAALNKDIQYILWSINHKNSPKIKLAIILLRMQDLWEIFEAMGTNISELVVSTVSDKISKRLRIEHQLYRFSTSELAILFVANNQEEVKDIVKRIRKIGEEETLVNGIPIRVQTAAGSYIVKSRIRKPDTITNRARTALFSAIDSGSFYKAYDPSLDQKTSERVKLISKVREGLRKDEFELFYQPKVSVTSGIHVGGEALLRWFKPDGSLVMPGLFMPKLEKTSLIDPVTRFVFRRVCQDIKNHRLTSVSLNLSVANLMDDDLIAFIVKEAKLFKIKSGIIEIEITEGALIQDPEKAKLAVKQLRDSGFKVSLDDFGTGYSSFQYLCHLPLTGLKIDKAFVDGIDTRLDARTVVESMISMAHALNLDVTVEGIETETQLEIVKNLGADCAQGFLFSRALSLPKYLSWASSWRRGLG